MAINKADLVKIVRRFPPSIQQDVLDFFFELVNKVETIEDTLSNQEEPQPVQVGLTDVQSALAEASGYNAEIAQTLEHDADGALLWTTNPQT